MDLLDAELHAKLTMRSWRSPRDPWPHEVPPMPSSPAVHDEYMNTVMPSKIRRLVAVKTIMRGPPPWQSEFLMS